MNKDTLLTRVRIEARQIVLKTGRPHMILNVSPKRDPNKKPMYAIRKYRIMHEITYNERMIELVTPD